MCSQEPESVFPVDEKPYKIVVTFIKRIPDEPVTADISLLGCFKPCELRFLTSTCIVLGWSETRNQST